MAPDDSHRVSLLLNHYPKAGLNAAALSQMQLPANMEDAIAEAMVNAR